jgi:UDP:flavonoid glycosyltransferase YjiC (YdhE family)
MMTAAAHGVPQVVVPTLPDQTFNAGRLAAAGAGVRVGGGEQADGDEVSARSAEVLSRPEYGRVAAALAGQIAARPTPADLVPRLEQLAATGQL